MRRANNSRGQNEIRGHIVRRSVRPRVHRHQPVVLRLLLAKAASRPRQVIRIGDKDDASQPALPQHLARLDGVGVGIARACLDDDVLLRHP